MTSDSRSRVWLLALAIGAVALYAPILTAWFVADDWDFLLLAHRASSPAVGFTPLLGRFLRPLEVWTYYVNYEAFGLRPLPYHLTVVLVHAVNAWLVWKLAVRLGAGGSVAGGAAVLFLAFGGHSEAVTWLGGAADAWLALMMLAALLTFANALERDRAAGPLAATCALFIGGFLAKETAAIAPALAIAYGASRAIASPADARRIVTRTAIVALVTALAAAGYMLMRAQVFGSVFGAYDQLSTSREMVIGTIRAFLLRCFVPPGRGATWLWVHHADLLLFAAGLAVIAWIVIRDRIARPGLLFLAAAMIISVAPAFPLTISLPNTVSERYIYTATAFSCILLAWVTERLFAARPALSSLVIASAVGVHAVFLVSANLTWRDAGHVARTITTQIVDEVRRLPAGTPLVLLNVPDTIDGAFVARSAILNTFHVAVPDVERPETRITLVASTMSRSADDTATVKWTGNTVEIALAQGRFAEKAGTLSPLYTVERWADDGFAISFTDAAAPVRVLYTSGGRLHVAAADDGGGKRE